MPSSIKIISLDGALQEFNEPIKAAHVLRNPLSPRRTTDCFLCSGDTMLMGAPPPPVQLDDELHPDQIYFLLPMSRSHYPISLQDLCSLAIRASMAFGWLEEKEWSSAAAAGDGGDKAGAIIGTACCRVGDGLCWTEIRNPPSVLISK